MKASQLVHYVMLYSKMGSLETDDNRHIASRLVETWMTPLLKKADGVYKSDKYSNFAEHFPEAKVPMLMPAVNVATAAAVPKVTQGLSKITFSRRLGIIIHPPKELIRAVPLVPAAMDYAMRPMSAVKPNKVKNPKAVPAWKKKMGIRRGGIVKMSVKGENIYA